MDPAVAIDEASEIGQRGRTPYAGCLSISFSGQYILSAMPQYIELMEVGQPLFLDPPLQLVLSDEDDWLAFEPPPLIAAARFQTTVRRGTLPPPEWDC